MLEIIKDTKIEKFGIVIRLVKYSASDYTDNDLKVEVVKYSYGVEQTPLMKDSTYDKQDFTVFGGSVGFGTSAFVELETAKEFFNDIVKLTNRELVKKYPDLIAE